MTEEIKPESAPPPEDFKDKYFRALAEMENMRKRMQKEQQEMLRFGQEQLLAEFLPVIDSFETALKFADQASGDVKNWATGFKMILAQFQSILQDNNVAPFHSERQRFNPIYHEAVEMFETLEHEPGTILQEFTKGYKTAERVLRAARVKVAKRPAASEEIQPQKEE